MERLSIVVFGVSKLRLEWDISSHTTTKHFPLEMTRSEEMEWLLLWQDIVQTGRVYTTRSSQIISVILLGNFMNMSITQVYAPTRGAEEVERESVCVSIQEEFDYITKQGLLIIIGGGNAK